MLYFGKPSFMFILISLLFRFNLRFTINSAMDCPWGTLALHLFMLDLSYVGAFSFLVFNPKFIPTSPQWALPWIWIGLASHHHQHLIHFHSFNIPLCTIQPIFHCVSILLHSHRRPWSLFFSSSNSPFQLLVPIETICCSIVTLYHSRILHCTHIYSYNINLKNCRH